MSEQKLVLDNQTILLSELVIKVAAIEKILMDAGILTEEKLLEEIKKVAEKISSMMASLALKDQISSGDPDKNTPNTNNNSQN